MIRGKKLVKRLLNKSLKSLIKVILCAAVRTFLGKFSQKTSASVQYVGY